MRMLATAGMFTIASIALLAIGGCGEPADEQSPGAQTSGTPVVYTTFYPTQFFAERIGGEHFEIVCPVPAGEDPITWRPSRDQIQAYRDADLIIINGASFEQWIETASLPTTRVINTSKSFEDEFVTYETVTHSHGPGGEHTHEGIDGHTWLDPINAKRQAEAILEAMIAKAPEQERALRGGFASLAADLDTLDARLQQTTAALGDRTLLCSHPAYNYLAKRYGWSIKNFDFDPDAPISEGELAELTEAAPAILLWESEPLASTQASLTEAGILSVTFSPCELLGRDAREGGKTYLEVMQANLDRLDEAIQRLAKGSGAG